MADVTGPSWMNDPTPPKMSEGQTCDICGLVPASCRVVGEKDSFGIEWLDACRECLTKLLEEEGNQKVVCRDCKADVCRKDTIRWRWYDFYAAQGDEPIIICNPCTQQPKHKARVRMDAAERDAELDRYPGDDY